MTKHEGPENSLTQFAMATILFQNEWNGQTEEDGATQIQITLWSGHWGSIWVYENQFYG